jgi:hypothetical protein
VVWLALGGYPRLAADNILSKAIEGKLEAIVGNVIRQLNLEFVKSPSTRKWCYDTLIEVALNLTGLERKRSCFSDEETETVLKELVEALRGWETQERKEGGSLAITEVVQAQIVAMKKVLFGQGMVSKMGEAIEGTLDAKNLAESFVLSSRREIQGNVYYKIVDEELSKLGNDSATGLRWLRHMGAVQVSSNPVIAARAYEELPDLWEKFSIVRTSHPEWRVSPEKFGDEIAMYATITALLPNLLDFRPIALLSDFKEGMVSIQLNPYRAQSLEGSLTDARTIYSILRDILALYDAHLWGGAAAGVGGRPNVVFKVASASAVAVEITQALDSLGIGTNNTVTFTVSQEIELAMAAMNGLAKAWRSGIPTTRVYITNMEGRLEDHLRETAAAKLLKEYLERTGKPDASLRQLAETLHIQQEVENAGTVDEKVAILCARRNLKDLSDDWFANLIPEGHNLRQMERDIRWSGIFVTRRVYGLAFGPAPAEKWAEHLQAKFGLPADQARDVVSNVDLLPASKRREDDTYQVLGGRHTESLTNTEFPDQQLKVWTYSRTPGFKLSDFENTLASPPDLGVLSRLLTMEDFRKAYELTERLSEELSRIGIEVPAENAGLGPAQWNSYGPVQKTMREFMGAYLGFRNKLLESVGQVQHAAV